MFAITKCTSQTLQERALRIVYNTKSVEYSNLLNRANPPSLQNRRLQDIATLMYKVKYGLVPSNVSDIFSVKSSKYHLRNKDFSHCKIQYRTLRETFYEVLWTIYMV